MATMAMRTEPGKGPTSTTISRETKNGRTLTYSLTVIQQPERARACGSGAKSSADRRPVDPPPVVELRVFDDDKDITFSYGANFFLFATLEVARPIAHGRVQPTSAPQVPVLTGMPVSGMAYLDRPKEAGYFIFPDLSVRHEGIYTLSFNLYEETREGQEDGETDGKGSAANHGDTSFDWRMEVKSRMFTVFSAKKFPGLAESTLLSRTVAEQGCRVRIRRDVRMRRRDGKGAAPEVEVQQEEAYRPGARQLEQEYRERSRSNSGSPDGRPNQEGYRSQSGDPIAAHAPAPAGGYLNFNQQPQFHAPMPAQNSYPPQQHSGPPQHHAAPYQPTGHWNDRQYPQSANPYHHPQEEEFRRSEEGRRASSWQPPTQHPIQPPFSQNPHYPVVDTGYNSRASFSHARPYSPVQRQLPPLPPPQASLKMPRIDFAESKYEHSPSPAGPLASFGRNAHPLPSPSHYAHDRYNHFSAPPLAPAPVEPIRSGNKRSHDQVFHSSSSTQPLHNGMRPDSVPAGQAAFDEDDENEDDAAAELLATQNAMRMQYKRADGGFHARVLPLGD